VHNLEPMLRLEKIFSAKKLAKNWL
jgi:hypothetical protein